MSTLIGQMVEVLLRDVESCGIWASRKDRRVYGSNLRDNLLDARRFHLSSKTAQVASTLGFEAKDTNALMSLARPPFIRTWLEWKLQDQFAGLGMQTADDAPERCGVMVYKGKGDLLLITSVLYGEKGLSGKPEVIISPVSIVFDPDNVLDKSEDGIYGSSREIIGKCVQRHVRDPDGARYSDKFIGSILDGCMVGGTVDKQGKPVTANQAAMVDHASWIFTPMYSEPYTQLLRHGDVDVQNGISMIISERVTESSGVLRFVIGALALINSKEYITTTPVKATDKRPPEDMQTITGKRSPSYDFVEFTAPHKVFVRDIIESNTTDEDPQGPKRPQHEVIGHFAHSRKIGDPNCEHNYEKRGENSWICLGCGKKRWFRKEHKRGDASIGVVERKDRLVIT